MPSGLLAVGFLNDVEYPKHQILPSVRLRRSWDKDGGIRLAIAACDQSSRHQAVI